MPSPEYVASKISLKIRRRLTPGRWTGAIGAVFARSLNLEMGDGFLIHIGSDALPLTPRSVLLKEEDFHGGFLPRRYPGEPVFAGEGFITCGKTRVKFLHPRTRLYSPALPSPEELSGHPDMFNRLRAALQGIETASHSPFRNYFLSRVRMIGASRAGGFAGPAVDPGENVLSRQVKAALWERADGLLGALGRDDGRAARGAARGLLGLGPGLTPSGDDFLAGLFAAGCPGRGSPVDGDRTREAAAAAWAAVREEAFGRTTSVSVAMLADAADGDAAEPVKQFWKSVFQGGGEEEIQFWAGEICRIGASSGEDLLNGLACGMLFFHRRAFFGQGERAVSPGRASLFPS